MKERKVKGKELESKEGRKKARERERASSMRFRGRRRCRIAAVWSGWRNATRRPPAAPAAAPAAAPRATRPRPRTTASCAGLRCAASSPASAPPRRSSNRCRCAAHSLTFLFLPSFSSSSLASATPTKRYFHFVPFLASCHSSLFANTTTCQLEMEASSHQGCGVLWFFLSSPPTPTPLRIYPLLKSIYIYSKKSTHKSSIFNHRWCKSQTSRFSYYLGSDDFFQKQHGTFFFRIFTQKQNCFN